MLSDSVFCMTECDGKEGLDGDGGSFSGHQQQLEVLAAEKAQPESPPSSSSDLSQLILRTNLGPVEVALDGQDDRDSMLAGFGLLLASVGSGGGRQFSPSPGAGGLSVADDASVGTEDSVVDRGAEGTTLKQWDRTGGNAGAEGGGGAGAGGMVLESPDEDSDDGSGEVPPAGKVSPLDKDSVKAE